MSDNNDADCQLPSARIKPFAEIEFIALKPKTQCIGRKKLGFSPPLMSVVWCGDGSTET